MSNNKAVLSWDAIVEALVEDDYDKNGNGEGHVSTNLVGASL